VSGTAPVFDEDDDVRRYRQAAEDMLVTTLTNDPKVNAELIAAHLASMQDFRARRGRGEADWWDRDFEEALVLLGAYDRWPPFDIVVTVDPSRITVQP
jgi:hypothetical protein